MWQETNFANRGADYDFGQANCDFERANYDFGQADYDFGSKKDTGWVIFLSRSAGIERKMLAFTAICLFPDAYHAKRVKANWLFQPVSYPTKKRYFNPASRLHARITSCGSACCCERYILHASFTHRSLCARFIASLQGDTHRASLRYERCFQYIRRKSVKAEPVRASVAANLRRERCVKDASFTTFPLSTASYTAVNVWRRFEAEHVSVAWQSPFLCESIYIFTYKKWQVSNYQCTVYQKHIVKDTPKSFIFSFIFRPNPDYK